jgi:hypothetical protein
MRRNDLVRADIANADPLGYEADDIPREAEDGEAADNAAERAGGKVAVRVEQAYGIVQAELEG